MRTLLISDLHLGSRMRRDVLRRPVALDRLVEAIADVDRVVLLGDTIEMMEGRAEKALAEAEPVLRAIGAAVGKGKDVIMVPGNHDHALVAPWLEERREKGKALSGSDRVPLRSSPQLQTMARWLKPARLQVRYPGLHLGDGVWAHHGHYLDRHLIRQSQVAAHSTPDEYETILGTSLASFGAGLGASLPGPIAASLERAGGVLQAAARGATIARPMVASLPGAGRLAPMNAAALGFQFRRSGLPAMATVAGQLGVDAKEIVFGHLHRAGPREGDKPQEWAPGGEARLWNTGSWVYEPLLVAGGSAANPYWPGGAVLVDGPDVKAFGLLDDVDESELR